MLKINNFDKQTIINKVKKEDFQINCHSKNPLNKRTLKNKILVAL